MSKKLSSLTSIKQKLKRMNSQDRLNRHAQLEISYAQEIDKGNMLTKALKQSQLENAGLRSQLKNIIEAHSPLEKRV